MSNSIKKFSSFSFILFLLCFSFSFTAYAAGSELQTDYNTTVAVDESNFEFDYNAKYPCDISKSSLFNVTIDDTEIYYNGLPQTPKPKVYYNNLELTENVDYSVSYADNVNAGTGKAIIKGIGKFSGTAEKSFNIKRLSIAKKGMTEITFDKSALTFDGNPVCPPAYIVYGAQKETQLVEGVDYIIEYSNNEKIGKGKAKISGIGNYSGVINKKFKIIPKQVTNLAVSSVTTSTVTLKWTKITGVSGYQVLSYNIEKQKYVSQGTVSAGKNSFTVKKLSTGKEYNYVVRAYKLVDDKKYYGPYSEQVFSSVKPADVPLTAVTKSGNKLIVDWKKVPCSGYEIFYSTDSKMKKKVKRITVSSKKNTRKISGINKSKRYYVKIRAYSVVNGKKIYGKKSAVVSSYFSNVYATYYSYYVNNANRTTNLRIASKAINGTIIQPGETFSFNEVVGARTAAKGYKDAHVFSDSTTVSDEIGGGICQVASTMFNCVLKANLSIVERHQHTQRVSYVPLGRDAAIYGTAENFRWKNNTKYAIQIKMSVKDGKISCTFYTCKKKKPSKVKLNVTRKGKNFTLKRVVKGKTNYTCRSNY